MMSFRQWLVLREGIIKTPVPPKPQELKFSCGAGALRSVLHYFNIETTEKEIRSLAKTNRKEGTRTSNLIKAARYYGLETKANRNMDEKELKSWLDEKTPVIICFQAWGNEAKYKKKKSGHYAVVIGYDKNNVYLQDPAIHTNARGHLSWEEFMKRWYDIDGISNARNRYGIACWKANSKRNKKHVSKSKKIS